jgi:hypothetical protein
LFAGYRYILQPPHSALLFGSNSSTTLSQSLSPMPHFSGASGLVALFLSSQSVASSTNPGGGSQLGVDFMFGSPKPSPSPSLKYSCSTQPVVPPVELSSPAVVVVLVLLLLPVTGSLVPLVTPVSSVVVAVAVVSGSTGPVLPVALISPPGPAELGAPVVGGSPVGPLLLTPPDELPVVAGSPDCPSPPALNVHANIGTSEATSTTRLRRTAMVSR